MNIKHRRRHGREGFTLVELLVVIAIVGILAQIAAPSLGGVLRSWRSKQAADQIVADLSYARALAIRSGGSRVAFQGSNGYSIEEVTSAGATVQKSVDLSREYGEVRLLLPSGVTEIVFDQRGMALAGAGQYVVESTSDGVVRRVPFWLSVLGMVRREA